MITIPTGDFVGILNDVIPMASTEDELPQINAVRLEWDGELLHAMATDRYRIAWSSYDPDDPPEKEYQPALNTGWGGADEPWSLSVSLEDAEHLAKTYKLGGKQYYVPLTIEHGNGTVKVARSRDTGFSAITFVASDRTNLDQGGFPDLRALLAKADVAEATKELALSARLLADFAKVRPRGPMHCMFTGSNGLVHIAIGKRFVGAIQPIREE